MCPGAALGLESFVGDSLFFLTVIRDIEQWKLCHNQVSLDLLSSNREH